jgi:hypothetical protein
MKQQVPELRMVLVAGPRLPREAFPAHRGLDVLPYVHNLFEHLACSDGTTLRAVHPRHEPPA